MRLLAITAFLLFVPPCLAQYPQAYNDYSRGPGPWPRPYNTPIVQPIYQPYPSYGYYPAYPVYPIYSGPVYAAPIYNQPRYYPQPGVILNTPQWLRVERKRAGY